MYLYVCRSAKYARGLSVETNGPIMKAEITKTNSSPGIIRNILDIRKLLIDCFLNRLSVTNIPLIKKKIFTARAPEWVNPVSNLIMSVCPEVGLSAYEWPTITKEAQTIRIKSRLLLSFIKKSLMFICHKYRLQI